MAGFAVIFFVGMWVIRLGKLVEVMTSGVLGDFVLYYQAARSIVSGLPDLTLILKSTFGPPVVLLPFIPFAFFELKTAELMMIAVNGLGYFATYYFVFKKYAGKLTWFFWTYLGLLAFSFPVIFSLVRGNPMGLVVWGIYAPLVLKHDGLKWSGWWIAVILKIFPIVSVLSLIRQIKWETVIILTGLTLGLSMSIFPPTVWPAYVIQAKNTAQNAFLDKAIYNQSFESSLARVGLESRTFSPGYWLFAIGIGVLVVKYTKREKRLLPATIAWLCLGLLVHPAPWQYYFVVFLPFLMIKIYEKKWEYVLPFLLLSFNGEWLRIGGVWQGLLNSSQFVGTLILLGIMYRESRRLKDFG